MTQKTESWGTRIGLILAMAGNAVGLGNFLRFPMQAMQNGGGAFIIPYVVCFVLMGIPLMWMEWSTGRFGGRNGNHSTPFILNNMSPNPVWKYFGVFGIFTNIGVAAYYCYIESWTLSYVFHSLAQTFNGLSQSETAAFFGNYIDIFHSTTGIPYEAVVFYLLCLALNTYILSRGLSAGVEKVATWGMPILIFFGIILAIRGITLGASSGAADCTDCDSHLGLNFLWEPQYGSLTDPKVWLAAAGQIFFTLSVGMGTIQCYAAYVRENDDIALNAMSAGWMNAFVEVVLGASVVIPIAVGYLGLDWVKENAGFAMAFQTMPYLFTQWGSILGTFGGVMWFGLLFFAGITSSLAMGTPWIGFMQDEFGWNSKKGALSFGIITALVGLPTVFFFSNGVFDEYDYWAGTVSLVVFALAESILFGWIFGIDKGWEELKRGADIQIPLFFKFVMKYVTPVLLGFIFFSSLLKPANGDWGAMLSGNFELDNQSIIARMYNKSVKYNRSYFADYLQADTDGSVAKLDESKKTFVLQAKRTFFVNKDKKIKPYAGNDKTVKTFDSIVDVRSYTFDTDKKLLVQIGAEVKAGDKIATGSFINDIFFLDLGKLILVLLFLFICGLVYLATKRREIKEKYQL
jgi:SNF family Na+-dependent transporter